MSSIVHVGDCAGVMRTMPTSSVDLIVTSPPYWNQKEYSFWYNYGSYLRDVSDWIDNALRLLKPGRYCFWVIPDKLPHPPKDNGGNERQYCPIYSDTELLAAKAGFVCEFPIIWVKPHGIQKMFGSFPYPPTIIHTQVTERICVWRKPGKPDLARKTDASKITSKEWSEWAVDVWEINPETNINHPAPFPPEIPRRIIKMWSFVGDTVLDPFCGSGTTGVAAKLLDRDFIGIEKDAGYASMATGRIETTYQQGQLFSDVEEPIKQKQEKMKWITWMS